MSFTQSDEMQRIRAAFEAARAAKQAGDAPKALEQWAKVLEWTDGASEKEPRQARLASSSESAVVYQELGDARTAERLLKQAVELAEDLVAAPSDSAPEKRVGDRLALAGVHVNLAGLYVTSREPEPGLTHADRALEVLTKVGEHPARGMLAFAGTLQRGTAHLLLGGFSEAQTSLREATDQGTELMTAGQTHILPQLVECAGRLFAAAKAQKSPQDALASIEQVARIATATFEAQGAPALQIFVNAQMHRINALLEIGRFAEAEDQLWHMIDGSGQGNILLSAPDFYVSLYAREDEVLREGGLPREEIVESWKDAIEQAADREADKVAVEAMRQRFALHTEGSTDQVQRFLAEHAASEGDLAPLAAALLRGLQKELNAALSAQRAG